MHNGHEETTGTVLGSVFRRGNPAPLPGPCSQNRITTLPPTAKVDNIPATMLFDSTRQMNASWISSTGTAPRFESTPTLTG
jgi:hypothetical protein